MARMASGAWPQGHRRAVAPSPGTGQAGAFSLEQRPEFAAADSPLCQGDVLRALCFILAVKGFQPNKKAIFRLARRPVNDSRFVK